MRGIPFEQISFVVQGPVDKTLQQSTGKPVTESCIESLRTWFPGSTIILSTWEGADVSGLDYDALVLSADPGAWNFMLPGDPRVLRSNGNRQIVSTRAGLKHVGTRFAAKVRSDVVLSGNAWLDLWDKFPRRAPEWRMFRERIVTGNLYARNPLREVPKPFHPSDWFMFGLTEDLLLLWDIDLEPEPESSYWFRSRPHPKCMSESHDTRRYQAEQYLWKTLLEKFGPIQFDNLADATPENIRLTQLTFANNLIILDAAQLPLMIQKHGTPRRMWRYCCYSHREWARLYRRYCCGERLESALERLLDVRHIGEGLYCLVPDSVRDGAWKLSSVGKQIRSLVRAA
jgi:hypothetical protein